MGQLRVRLWHLGTADEECGATAYMRFLQMPGMSVDNR